MWQKYSWHSWQYHEIFLSCCSLLLLKQNQQRLQIATPVVSLLTFDWKCRIEVRGKRLDSGETRGLREGGKGLRERGETEWRQGHRGWGEMGGLSDEKTLNEEEFF